MTESPDQHQPSEFEQQARQAMDQQHAPSAFGDIQKQLPEGSIKKSRLSREMQPPPENRQAADLPTRQQPVPEKRKSADLPTIQQPVPDLRTKVWEPGEQLSPSTLPADSPKSPASADAEAAIKEQRPAQEPVTPVLPAREEQQSYPEHASSKAVSAEPPHEDIAKQSTSSLDRSKDEIAAMDTGALGVPGYQQTEKTGRNPRDFFDGREAKDEIPDLPTTPVIVPSPAASDVKPVEPEVSRAKVPDVVRASTPAPAQDRTRGPQPLVREQSPLQPSAPPETPQNWQQVGAFPAPDRRQATPLPETSRDWQPAPPVTPAPTWQDQPAGPSQARGPRIDTSKLAAMAVGALKSRPNRWPWFVGVALALIIVVVGLLVLLNPFEISPITQPNVSYTNASLNVSLAYPTDWKVNTNQTNTSVHFYDSTNTGQVTVSTAAGGQNLSQFLKNQANQLGMTGVNDASPVTFGGTTWQQVKGSMQNSGASYTGTLLATEHQGKIYTLVQLAPQATYGQEDQIIFSPIRSSFKFIG